MHIPGLCAGGIREKTEEMNFPVPEERCQTDACWDRSHTHHAQNISPRNETYLNSQCARVHLSLCRTDVCVVCTLVKYEVPKREYLTSFHISLGCTTSVYSSRRGQKVMSM
ncbi:hypothetical protein ABG768_012490 [Culter alburnus]|uniref:Uncharacterized protein n=1 Tax=Culter alburnus TaxID=194366 RepID=A0AAW2B140_CULAL